MKKIRILFCFSIIVHFSLISSTSWAKDTFLGAKRDESVFLPNETTPNPAPSPSPIPDSQAPQPSTIPQNKDFPLPKLAPQNETPAPGATMGGPRRDDSDFTKKVVIESKPVKDKEKDRQDKIKSYSDKINDLNTQSESYTSEINKITLKLQDVNFDLNIAIREQKDATRSAHEPPTEEEQKKINAANEKRKNAEKLQAEIKISLTEIRRKYNKVDEDLTTNSNELDFLYGVKEQKSSEDCAECDSKKSEAPYVKDNSAATIAAWATGIATVVSAATPLALGITGAVLYSNNYNQYNNSNTALGLPSSAPNGYGGILASVLGAYGSMGMMGGGMYGSGIYGGGMYGLGNGYGQGMGINSGIYGGLFGGGGMFAAGGAYNQGMGFGFAAGAGNGFNNTGSFNGMFTAGNGFNSGGYNGFGSYYSPYAAGVAIGGANTFGTYGAFNGSGGFGYAVGNGAGFSAFSGGYAPYAMGLAFNGGNGFNGYGAFNGGYNGYAGGYGNGFNGGFQGGLTGGGFLNGGANNLVAGCAPTPAGFPGSLNTYSSANCTNGTNPYNAGGLTNYNPSFYTANTQTNAGMAGFYRQQLENQTLQNDASAAAQAATADGQRYQQIMTQMMGSYYNAGYGYYGAGYYGYPSYYFFPSNTSGAYAPSTTTSNPSGRL